MATRSSYGVLLDQLLSAIRGSAESVVTRVYPSGGYEGVTSYTVSTDSPIVTNPWSVPAYTRYGSRSMSSSDNAALRVYLEPGQSYNYLTGQFNDPTIHNKTAARLNQQVNQLKTNEAGLSQVFQDSARNGKSVLATVDELYWGDVRTSAYSGTKLSTMKQAAQGGFNTSGGKTVLGDSD